MATAKQGLSDVGWTRNLKPIPFISMGEVQEIINKHSKVPSKHLDRGYRHFFGHHVHGIEVKVHPRGCFVRVKCCRSFDKKGAVWNVHISMLNSKEIESQSCAYSAGKGSCAHVAALVYQVAHYKTLHKTTVPELVPKTSCPQSFHIPSKVDGIKPRPVNEVSLVKPNPKKSLHEQSESCICSTLYNPVNTPYPDNSFLDGIQTLLPLCDDTLQIFKILPQTSNRPPVKTTAYGTVYIGSTLAHQLPEPKADGSIFRIPEGPEFPKLPVHDRYVQSVCATVLTENESLFMDSMQVSESESVEIEHETRSQSLNPLWNRLRQKRLTASIFKDVVSRQKAFESLVERLTSGRKIQTAAMKHGLEHECEAALEYSTHKQVNVRPCGFVINPAAPFIGASPDRIVYDPSESDPLGLLEIKCPLKESYKEAPCLKGNSDGTFTLRESNSYYMQVMGQMAVTGLPWCDFVSGQKTTCISREFILMTNCGLICFPN